MKNLSVEKKVLASTIMAILYISLVLITCTCSGQKLTLVHPTIERQIDYSLYSGKLVKQITDVTECAILKTDGVDLALWHQPNLLTWQQSQVIQDLVYSPKQELMQKKCLQIKLYQYPLTIRFSSNQYKMVWTGQKLNWHIAFRHPNLLEENLKKILK